MDYMSNSKPIHEVLNIIKNNIQLQVHGVDSAIPYLIGPPGGGKTESIRAFAKSNNWGFISTHFALKPIEEMGGIPQFKNFEINGEQVPGTVWSFPDIHVELHKLSKSHEIVLWLLDDLHLCSHIHMTMLYELFTERAVRSYKLPKNTALICAGNAGNKTGAKTLFSAIVNRVFFAPVHTDFDNWKKWAISNKVNDSIVSFLTNDTYRKYFHEEEQVDTPWCSPRSWTRLANMITMHEFSNDGKPIDINLLQYLSQGHVGKDAASDFSLYYEIYRKFDCEKILENSDDFEIPKDAMDRYAIAYAIVLHFINNYDKKLVNPLAKIIIKYMEDAPELSVIMLRELQIYEKQFKKKFLSSVIMELQKLDDDLTTKFVIELGELDV